MSHTQTTDHSSPTTGDQQWIGAPRSSTSSRLRGMARRRSIPHLSLGVLLLLACVGGFLIISLHSDDRETVLALVRDVRIGQVLAAADVREVRIAVDAGVAVIHADEVGAVVGKPVTTSLSAGSLLGPGVVGRQGFPEAGQGIAAIALKPGRYPPGLAAGSRVSVVLAPDRSGGATDSTATWPATVVEVTSVAGEQSTVVAVQLRESAALDVAAAPAGQLAVVLLPSGGR